MHLISPAPRRRIAAGLALSCAISASLLVGTAPTASAASVTISRVNAGGLTGHVGVDVPGGNGQYASHHYWDEGGSIAPIDVGNPQEWARFEFYPNTSLGVDGYDPWTVDVGGVHIERRPSDGAGWLALGEVTLPKVGESFAGHTASRFVGDIVSSSDVPDDRIQVDVFQVETAYPDPLRPLPTNATGVEMGAFSSIGNRGDQWTGGVGWPGRYMIFVSDSLTGNRIQAFQDLGYGPTPTIDLDAICFGFDQCQYNQGGPGTSAGMFHPTDPTRLLDTRFGLGIANGPVRQGGGRYDTLDPNTRRDWIANHEVKVTGLHGVPESGVSAVLLNVTAVAAPGPGYLSVTPKPAHCCGGLALFDDQASLIVGEPATSNLNMAGGDIVPNLVLARVGAGGKIRLYNSTGDTHVIADLAGWFGTGGAHTDGAGFSGVMPSRVFDTRTGLASADEPFSPGEVRSVKVAGVAGIPADAESVVVNLTVAAPVSAGFATAFPTGSAVPNASNLNFAGGDVRANLAVVKIGDGGRISLSVAETSADLVVDVMGSFGSGGGTMTAIEPTRIADSRGGVAAPSRKLHAGEAIEVPVRGRGGVPDDATAVVLNVSAVDPDGFGYFTVWPHGGAAPESSNVNFAGGQSVPNMVMVSLGANGAIDLRNSVNSAHVVIDVMGYVR